MCGNTLLSILCILLAFNEVCSACDRAKGPLGLTGCVHSPSFPKDQAAICVSKYMIKVSRIKHIACKWKDSHFCWFLCSATASHGGLSACECQTQEQVQIDKSNIIGCFFPYGSCSWFSKCLAKKKNCSSVSEIEKKCKEWDKSSRSMNEGGKEWVRGVKSCIQENLVHVLYPQLSSDCEEIKLKIELLTKTCYMETHNGFRYCDLDWGDIFDIDGFFPGLRKYFKDCPEYVPYISKWAKLLVFYLENKTGKDIDYLTSETGRKFALVFNWKESGLTYKSISPDIITETSKSIPIRVHLYSETKDEKKIEDATNILKKYLANRKELVLTLTDGTPIKVTQVMSCSDPHCLGNHLFPFQTDLSCLGSGGTCQDDTTQCEEGSYIPAECYESSRHKCCLPTPRDQDTGDCADLVGLQILSRDTWGAARPDNIRYIKLPLTRFFIHHTAGEECSDTISCSRVLRGIQNYHMSKSWGDIGYNFLIASSGQIFEGRGWNRFGVHTYNYNHNALAAAFMGNFNDTLPSESARTSVHKLLECAVRRKVISDTYSLYGHYDVTNKTKDTVCPGYTLYNAIRNWDHYNIIADRDGPCLSKGGKCLPNYLPCDGTFQVDEDQDLCEGNTQRQCCIPPVT